LVNRGYQVWVFGSAREQSLGDRIAGDISAVTNLCGRTRLEDVVDLVALCRRVVSNDSGLMHVACAAGTQVIAIYGSSSPSYTPPLSDDAVVLYEGLDCSPCFDRICRYGHTNCLAMISVEEIMGCTGARSYQDTE